MFRSEVSAGELFIGVLARFLEGGVVVEFFLEEADGLAVAGPRIAVLLLEKILHFREFLYQPAQPGLVRERGEEGLGPTQVLL